LKAHAQGPNGEEQLKEKKKNFSPARGSKDQSILAKKKKIKKKKTSNVEYVKKKKKQKEGKGGSRQGPELTRLKAEKLGPRKVQWWKDTRETLKGGQASKADRILHLQGEKEAYGT